MTPLAICAAALKSRGAYETVRLGGVESEVLPEELISVWKAIERFYETDKEAKSADPEIVKAYASEGLSNPKHAEHIARQVEKLVTAKVSADNIAEMLRLVYRNRVADRLANALASRHDEDSIEPLIEEYKKLSVPVLEEEDMDWQSIIKRRLDQGARLKLLPKSLNEYLGGGVMPGHNLTLFARPEAGKTALAITMAVGFATQGHKVLYVINEDDVRDLAVRALCSTLQQPADYVRADMERAIAEGLKKGLGNLVLRELSPGSLRELEALVKKHQPRVLIVDQLRNLKIAKTDNFTQGLDHNAQGLRALGKRYGMVTIGITQAGDSASNRPVLDLGDVDSSNTGIPGAADVMIGLGVTDQLRQAGQRVISVSKNKVSGAHGYFTVSINEAVSRVKSNV